MEETGDRPIDGGQIWRKKGDENGNGLCLVGKKRFSGNVATFTLVGLRAKL